MNVRHTFFLISMCGLLALLVVVVTQILIVWLNGGPVPTPTIPRDSQTVGSGPKLTYVVMGDSTTIAQGAPYEDGYAVASAKHLAKRHEVTFTNVGVSGAVAQDVAHEQVEQAVGLRPDIVLIAVGANDVTHLTPSSSVERSMTATIDRLRATNPHVRIVATGAPAMDAVDRFPWLVQRLASQRVKALNTVIEHAITSHDGIFAPIADQTREAFRRDPTLFAADKFHPNTRGYALWTPIINHALDEVLSQKNP